MDGDDLLEVFKEKHFYELSYRNSFDTKTQIAITVFAGELALYAYIIDCSMIMLDVGFAFFALLFLFPFLMSMKNLYMSFRQFYKGAYGWEYSVIPRSSSIDDYRQSLQYHYHHYEDTKENITRELKGFFYDYYRDASSRNFEINKTRSEYYHQMNRRLVYSIVYVFICCVLYFIVKIYMKSPF